MASSEPVGRLHKYEAANPDVKITRPDPFQAGSVWVARQDGHEIARQDDLTALLDDLGAEI